MALFFTVKHVHIINTMWKRKAVTNYVENVISSVCVSAHNILSWRISRHQQPHQFGISQWWRGVG